MLRTQLELFQWRDAYEEVITLAHSTLMVVPLAVQSKGKSHEETPCAHAYQNSVTGVKFRSVMRQINPWGCQTARGPQGEEDAGGTGSYCRGGTVVHTLLQCR